MTPRPLSVDAALLTALRQSSAPMPRSELAGLLGIPAFALTERLEGLRAAGFEIEMDPTLGCRLQSAPDRLIADDLWSRLNSPTLVREIIVLAETASTNDVAARLGREGAPGGVLVLAESQTAGRGRFGRAWESSAGHGIWLSLLLRPELPVGQWPRLTTWAAVALANAIDRTTGLRSAIKWPNDVQISGKKVAGILIEVGHDESHQPFAVVGIGVNANQDERHFSPELREIAQSLRLAAGSQIDRPALVANLLEDLHAAWRSLGDEFETLVASAAVRSSVLGRWIRVRAGDEILEGLAERLDAEGHLLLRRADGDLQTLLAGEVTLRGPSVP